MPWVVVVGWLISRLWPRTRSATLQFSPSQVTTVPWPLVLEGKSSYRYDIVDSDRGGAIPKSRRRALRLASQSFARAEPSPGDTETEVRFPFNNGPVGIVNHRRGVV